MKCIQCNIRLAGIAPSIAGVAQSTVKHELYTASIKMISLNKHNASLGHNTLGLKRGGPCATGYEGAMDPGGIAGIVLAVLLVIAAIILVYFYFQKRKKGDFLISEKPADSRELSYTNQGYVEDVGNVNVLDYSEIPFTAGRPDETSPRRPAAQRPISLAVNGNRVHISEDGDYATINIRNSKALGDPQNVDFDQTIAVAADDEEFEDDEGGMIDLDGDYATLDSVAKKLPTPLAATGVEPDAKHVTVIQLQQDVAHVQQFDDQCELDLECEYATVVPKSLRGNKDISSDSIAYDVDIDQSSGAFQTTSGVISSWHHPPYPGNEHFGDASLDSFKSLTENDESNVFVKVEPSIKIVSIV
ncbi:hypothetical protein Btru_055694 [Bulinus truncatus]|nr:hypothetical protein Btru_055694 [Bulinus truncatus]